MNYEIREAIKDVIEKSIPSEIGKQIQDRLALVDSLENQVEGLKEQLEEKTEVVKKLRDNEHRVTDRANRVSNREHEASQREASLEIQAKDLDERRHVINIAELSARFERERREELRDIIGDICKGPVMKRTLNRSVRTEVPNDSDDCFAQPKVTTEDEEETETAENDS